MANTQNYKPYHLIKQEQLKDKLDGAKKELPDFCEPFFRELDRFEGKATSTLLAYATDLRIFFTWAKEYVPEYAQIEIKSLPIDILNKLHVPDIKSYMLDYIPQYAATITTENKDTHEEESKEYVRKNSKTSAARKLATLKKFYHYYNNLSTDDKYYITNDPVSSIRQKKDNKQPVKYLTDQNTADLFACINSGDGLAGKSKKWSEHTRERDKAIIALFLGTGMRVSELAGINIQDVDFNNSSIKIFRKEQREDTVFMSESVSSTLSDYVNGTRAQILTPDKNKKKSKDNKDKDKDNEKENENALFLSLQHKRMSISAIERCVKKYTQVVTGENGYTCHKLRDTFGTRVYAETGGNAKKVQTAMNHKSASTSLDYYVAAVEGKEKEDTFKNTHIDGLDS